MELYLQEYVMCYYARKQTDLILEKAINICRTDETTLQQIKIMDMVLK